MAVAVVENAIDVRVAVRVRNLRLVGPVDRQASRRDRYRAEQRNLGRLVGGLGKAWDCPLKILPPQSIRRRADELKRRNSVAPDNDKVVIERHLQFWIRIAPCRVPRVRRNLGGEPTHLVRVGSLDFHAIKNRLLANHKRQLESRRVDWPSAAGQKRCPPRLGQACRILDGVLCLPAGRIPVQLVATRHRHADPQPVLLRHRLDQANQETKRH